MLFAARAERQPERAKALEELGDRQGLGPEFDGAMAQRFGAQFGAGVSGEHHAARSRIGLTGWSNF